MLAHEAAFQVPRGPGVEVNEFIRYPLLWVADEMYQRFTARNTEEEIQFGLFRIAIPAYSETAFREALANALQLAKIDYMTGASAWIFWRSLSYGVCPSSPPCGSNDRDLWIGR